jgi:hypothetical protein
VDKPERFPYALIIRTPISAQAPLQAACGECVMGREMVSYSNAGEKLRKKAVRREITTRVLSALRTSANAGEPAFVLPECATIRRNTQAALSF